MSDLIARLKSAQTMIGKMCSEGRPPAMSIPARPDVDEDLLIVAAIRDAIEALSNPPHHPVDEPVAHVVSHTESRYISAQDAMRSGLGYSGGSISNTVLTITTLPGAPFLPAGTKLYLQPSPSASHHPVEALPVLEVPQPQSGDHWNDLNEWYNKTIFDVEDEMGGRDIAYMAYRFGIESQQRSAPVSEAAGVDGETPSDELVSGWIEKAQGRYTGSLRQHRYVAMKYAEWLNQSRQSSQVAIDAETREALEHAIRCIHADNAAWRKDPNSAEAIAINNRHIAALQRLTEA